MIAILIVKVWASAFESVPGRPFSNIPFELDPGKMVGFLPVYRTLEDARADYPTASYITIEAQQKGKN